MLHIQDLSENGIQRLSATGTVLARDVADLFKARELEIGTIRGFMLIISPDFDGYLSELAKGLDHASVHLHDAKRRMAIVMPDGMLREAAHTGLTEDGDVLRTFSVSAEQTALEWLDGL